MMPDVFYTGGEIESTGGQRFAEFIARFCPATEKDRQLILAMFATAFWGGRGGMRPAFVVTADRGHGVGKSTLTDMLSHLAGGHVEISQHEDAAAAKKRLLSPEGIDKRIVRIDNIKSRRFSWADLESMITSAKIGGHQMYKGEATRPNTIVYCLTLNGVSLSTDLAQRCVIVKLQQPNRDASENDWHTETIRFIDQHRSELISDLIGFLQLPKTLLKRHGRWATWESEVLSRLPDPEAVQRLVHERMDGADTDAESILEIESYFGDMLRDLGFEPNACKVHIPNKIVGEWYCKLMNDRKALTEVMRLLRQYISQERLHRIIENPSKRHGSGFLWIGENCPESSNADYSLMTRLCERQKARVTVVNVGKAKKKTRRAEHAT